jgi:hypothetical protein
VKLAEEGFFRLLYYLTVESVEDRR